jgi:prepilin-type N-terminal cleavage/methylation domain-containing protein
MKPKSSHVFLSIGKSSGFTLIEMLIVVIILGILAMIIVPQISVSQEDAKANALKTNLGGLRTAIEIYYLQHNNTYPGMKKTDGSLTDVADIAESNTAFLAQMTQFTDVTGKVAATQTTAYPYGPYLKEGALPSNPYKDNTLLCDITVVDITLSTGVKRAATGATGWKYLAKLGVIFANDEVSALDEATKLHKTY